VNPDQPHGRFHRLRVWTRSLLVAVLAAVLFWTAVIMIFENRFIFFPSTYPDGPYDTWSAILRPEEHTFSSEDGPVLHAWFVKADTPLATILFFHGNAGNLSHRGEVLRRLQAGGFDIFIFDYRGYGKSEGSPNESGVYRDGRAAIRYLSSLPGVDTSRILYFGSSLGGAIAIDVATERHPAGLVLESTFSSAPDVARKAYPFLPIAFLLHSRFDSESKIGAIGCPLLSFHGTNDTVIPIELGRKLFQAAREPKQFYEVPRAGHNDLFLVAGQDFVDQVRSFAHFALNQRQP
jgi:fermentation-respiration switch protein FrsA (DUF1100 family)